MYFSKAQDISTIQNSIDVYSNTNKVGTAKFNAMAGSNGALGGDASALLTNPAGVGVAISSDANITLGIMNNKNTSSLNGSSINYSINKADMANASGIFTIPLMTESQWKFVNIALNYSAKSLENYVETPGNSNIVVHEDLLDGAGNPAVGNFNYLGHAYDRTGYQTVTNLGVGANYGNSLYFGVGLNMHKASIDGQYDSSKFNFSVAGTDYGTYVLDKQNTPYSEKSSGFSASLGVIGKVSNQVRLGASIETPTWWQLDRAYTEYSADTNGDTYGYAYAETRDFRSPMKATISGAFVPNKNFSLNVDYTLGFLKPKYRVQGGAEEELNSYFNDLSKSTSEVRVGAEYRIKAFRVRGGYSYASSPFDSTTISAYTNSGSVANTSFSNLIVGQRNTLGLGVGYSFSSFYVDATYQNVNTTYNNPFLYGNANYGSGYYVTADSNSNGDSFSVNSPSSAVSEVKNNRNNFFLTFGWKF